MNSSQISVLIVDPKEKAKETKIENTIGTFQNIVGGPIEIFRPWTDDVTIICNENGKILNLQQNRPINSKRNRHECSYAELCRLFTLYESTSPKKHLTGYITISEDSFLWKYEEHERTYKVSSADIHEITAGEYVIFGNSIDEMDKDVPLHIFINDEEIGWEVEKCFLIEKGEMLDIIAGSFIVCKMNWDTGEFESLADSDFTECLALFNGFDTVTDYL